MSRQTVNYSDECFEDSEIDFSGEEFEDEDFILEEGDDDSGGYSSSEDEENHSLVQNINKKEKNDSKNYFYGKNRYKWAKKEPVRNIASSYNTFHLPMVRREARTSDPSVLDSFYNIFDSKIIDLILKWTNKRLDLHRNKHPNLNTNSNYRRCSTNEMMCLLGLLFYTSAFKSNHETYESLFATDGTEREIFRLCMSGTRFNVLVSFLRTDDFESRQKRMPTDPGEAVKEMMELFNVNSQAAYSIGQCATIDEMLVGFRGRCKFKMYMPAKPNKYGLKIQCLADAKTHYVLNAYLYTGKGSDGMYLTEDEKKLAIPTQACLRLCKPIFNSNRNITVDNWYTSIELCNVMKERGLTVVGTLRKNKREIPPEFQASKTRAVESSLFGFTKDLSIVSFVPKKKKSVILLSSLHHSAKIDEKSSKPEIILYYNNTKGGVDAVDFKCSNYSCSRRTRRWPMAIFFRILDMAGHNSYIIHQSQRDAVQMSRLDYLKKLASELSKPYLEERMLNDRLPLLTRNRISTILGKPIQQSETNDDKLDRNKRKRCLSCTPGKRAKTVHLCTICMQPVCLHCSSVVCKNCNPS